MALTVCLVFDRDPSARFESRSSIARLTFTPKTVDEADDVHDPAELAEVDDEL